MNNKLKKPEAETITFYSYTDVVKYIAEKYQIKSDIFKENILALRPVDGKLLYLNVCDYIIYNKYDSPELLNWFTLLREEFGDLVILEYEES